MKRDVRLMKKRGKDMDKLEAALLILAEGKALPAKNRDHQLSGNLAGFRECHIEGDWLLIYRIFKDKLIVSASGTGTHADLFGN